MFLMTFIPVTRAGHSVYPAPAYASAAQVAAALRQIGANNDDRAVLQLDPYVVRAEHRSGTEQPAATPASSVRCHCGIGNSGRGKRSGRRPRRHFAAHQPRRHGDYPGEHAPLVQRRRWLDIPSIDAHAASLIGEVMSFFQASTFRRSSCSAAFRKQALLGQLFVRADRCDGLRYYLIAVSSGV